MMVIYRSNDSKCLIGSSEQQLVKSNLIKRRSLSTRRVQYKGIRMLFFFGFFAGVFVRLLSLYTRILFGLVSSQLETKEIGTRLGRCSQVKDKRLQLQQVYFPDKKIYKTV